MVVMGVLHADVREWYNQDTARCMWLRGKPLHVVAAQLLLLLLLLPLLLWTQWVVCTRCGWAVTCRSVCWCTGALMQARTYPAQLCLSY